jgi:hypothetical protein
MTTVTYIIASLGLFWAAIGLFNMLLLPDELWAYLAIIANLVMFVVPGLLVVLLAATPERSRTRPRLSPAAIRGSRLR